MEKSAPNGADFFVEMPLQQIFAFFPVRQVLFQQCVEPGAVVFLLDVAQFMDYHQIDGFLRPLHQEAGKAKAVGGAAATVSFLCAGDFYPGGGKAHHLTPEQHFFRQNGPGLLFQNSDLGFGGRRWRAGCFFLLCSKVTGDPVGVLRHKLFYVLFAGPEGRPNQYPAILGNFQRQSFPAGANQFIIIHHT